MISRTFYILSILVLVMVFGCTPKPAEQIAEQPVEPAPKPVEDKNLSPCKKFSDAPNPDDAETNYVLYRDFLKAAKTPEGWEKAYDYWQKVYKVAPAADGKRATVYNDGIRFRKYFYSQTTDEAEKTKLLNEIMELYDEIGRCYPKGGYILGSKAFDYYYEFPGKKSNEEIFNLFRKSVDIDGDKTNYFVLNPFTALLVEMYHAEKISVEEAKKYQQIISTTLENGLAKCKGKGCAKWKIIEDYVPARLEFFESVRGFYDCEYYKEKYFPVYQADPGNCETVEMVYSTLKWGGCADSDPKMQELISIMGGRCKPAPVGNPCAIEGREELRNGHYRAAIKIFNKCIADTDDRDKKAKYNFLIAKIYYGHLKNFPQARKYAYKAAKLKKGWGEPYLLIGRLYASSGPLCGPGRGWDSQIVVWPAIDMWEKAKKIDPSVRAEANKWLNKYRKYMPSKEDIFQRTLKVGDTFFVPCWIQESTIIRAAQ